MDDEASESDSSNDSEGSGSENSSDSDGSENGSECDSDDSEDESSFDSDDDSSLDSNFMAEMANELGFDIDERENATANELEFISHPQPSHLIRPHTTASYDTQLMRKECAISPSDTENRSSSHDSESFEASGTKKPEALACYESNSDVSDDVETCSKFGDAKCTSSLQIKPKPGSAPRSSKRCDSIVVTTPFESTTQGDTSSVSFSAHRANIPSNSAAPLTESDDDDESDSDDSDASEEEIAFSSYALAIPVVEASRSATTMFDEARRSKESISPRRLGSP